MNMPAFQRYSPVARYSAAVSRVGLLGEPRDVLGARRLVETQARPDRTYPKAVDGPVARMPIVTT